MIITYIFSISGLSIVLLIIAKKIEGRRKKPLFISNAISKGDIHIRKFYHTAVHLYSEGKEKTFFFFKKQIRMHSRNSLNKIISFLEEKRGQYIRNMRDSRLLKKSDGISEFFKNMSEVEKGNGVIHDIYKDGSQNEKKELE
jgi:hypothetical protein